jgi:hypothetical protein
VVGAVSAPQSTILQVGAMALHVPSVWQVAMAWPVSVNPVLHANVAVEP